MSAPTGRIRYGEVWVSGDEAMGAVSYLVVSSDAYNAAFGDRRVIAAEVDPSGLYQGTYREPIADVGTALLDRIVWMARAALSEQVGELHPRRHASVAARIRELIGNWSGNGRELDPAKSQTSTDSSG